MDSPPKAVLVTGAGSGIGRATAELLVRQGFRVFAGVRRRGSGQPLPETPPGTTPLQLDVTSPDEIRTVVERLQVECSEGLYALVNNAGVAPPAAVELADLDELRDVLEVNTLAPLRLIQACLPLLRRGGGRVVNMSSMNGTLAMPMVGAYSASKFALEALSETLRVELRPWGVRVIMIRPGQVRTDIFAKAREALDQRAPDIPDNVRAGYELLYARARRFNERGANSPTTPDVVARTVLRALTARWPRRIYLVGLEAVGLQLARNYLPRWLVEWAMASAMGTSRRSNGAVTQDGTASNSPATIPAEVPRQSLRPTLPDRLQSS